MKKQSLRSRIAGHKGCVGEFPWKFVRAAVIVALTSGFATQPSLADEASASAVAPVSATSVSRAAVEPEIVSITVPSVGAFGGDVAMHTEVYKPAGDGPFPTLIFSHGRAADGLDRAKLAHPIGNGHVRYWLAKGFAIVAPVRVGYGKTGGPDIEDSGSWFDSFGTCRSRPDYRKLARVTAQETSAAINWARAQTWVDSKRIVLEGGSVGGFATVATAATHPSGVIAYINFAGGAGGLPDRSPGHSCDPEQMKEVMAELGKTTALPGIWLYAENDHYWGPEAPRRWFDAFVSGGSPAEFVNPGELAGHDGHFLLSYGGKMWSVPVDRFVKQFGF
ncbi:alpha/beta hydrolase family protein [Trinickia sp. EG282A]|uniref:alpha/beta hydrolase family protein n=1 Tax=Trinickia sp. EG282A TaxID=3237013 RepID=UPI0034D1EEEF